MSVLDPFALGSFVQSDGRAFLGVVSDDAVTPVDALTQGRFPADVTLARLLQDWDANLATIKLAIAADRRRTPRAPRIPVTDLQAQAPVPDARQVFCTGANYGRHLVQMAVAVGGPETEGLNPEQRRALGEAFLVRQKAESSPYVFMKPVTSIAGPNDLLILPDFSEKADWEVELGVVIASPTYRVSRANALKHVAGYMVVNDLTARDKVKRTDPGAIGPDWIASKGAPGFLPTGPYLVPAEFVPDPQNLGLRLKVNGVMMQDDSTSDMTFDVARQIEFISSYARMLPGDILCTGTPGGNGVTRGIFLRDGDVMEVEIDGLGRQTTLCRRSASTER